MEGSPVVPFDPTTAKPQSSSAAKGSFDPSTARPGGPGKDDYNPWANIGQADPNLSLSDVGDMATGMAAGIPGAFGDVESLARTGINKLGGDVSSDTFLPTTTDFENYLSGEPTDERAQRYRDLGSVISPGLYTGVGALAKGAKAATAGSRVAKLGERVGSGEFGQEVLARPLAAKAARKAAADPAYDAAKLSMQDKFAAGDLWQENPAGRSFLDELQKRIATTESTKETAETRAALQRLFDDLNGQPKPGGGTAYSEPNVLIETVRRLRDAAKGDPKEGYSAIGQQRAGALANDLAQSISNWEPLYGKADAIYRAKSLDMYPEGVTPGSFSGDLKRAEKTINTLEQRFRNGNIPKKKIIGALRDTINKQSVTRLIDPTKAKQLNAELDSLERAQTRGDWYKKAARLTILLGGGYELYRGVGLLGVH